MNEKTYKLPAFVPPNDGASAGEPAQIVKTLAPPTNKNVANLLKALGLKSFREFYGGGDPVGAAIIRMDIGVDEKKFKEVLDIIFVEHADGINFDNIDLRVTDGAVQDFFEQRSKTMQERNGM
jgi:hypothetical protein